MLECYKFKEGGAMAKTGWIKLHRQIMDSDFYKEPRRFSRSEAWIDILLRTEWETGTLEIESYEKLAQRWNWSKSSVGRFIKILVNENMVGQRRDKFGTTLTVVNWKFYQGTRDKTGTRLTSKNEFLPITEKEDKNIYSELLSFWNQQKITVHRNLTEDMIKAIDATLKVHTKEEIMQAIARYAKIYHDKDYFFSYNWTLINFLKQKNALPDFMDEGQKWLSYKNATATKEPSKPKPDLDAYDIKQSWREEEGELFEQLPES